MMLQILAQSLMWLALPLTGGGSFVTGLKLGRYGPRGVRSAIDATDWAIFDVTRHVHNMHELHASPTFIYPRFRGNFSIEI